MAKNKEKAGAGKTIVILLVVLLLLLTAGAYGSVSYTHLTMPTTRSV